MIAKHIPSSKRIRKIPAQFSWLDHRLVRKGYMAKCSHKALALYLFLVTVADAEGLSYYGDSSAGRLLHMNTTELSSARGELCKADLIAYAKPFYQVLSLDVSEPVLSPTPQQHGASGNAEAVSIGDIIRQMAGGGQ